MCLMVYMLSCAGDKTSPEKSETTSNMEPLSEKPWTPSVTKQRKDDRNRMVSIIESYGVENRRVLEAMSRVPRHEFVPEKYEKMAYNDSPLPIGYGQTISQPFIVAKMTELLNVTSGTKVLEVGTGSGYQAAVLSEFTPHVFTLEIIEPLAAQAKKRFSRLGYTEITARQGDGYYGWPEEAPFDAIIVTAAAGEIPPPLTRQLKNGGRMIIPVGSALGAQSLMLVEKDEEGDISTRNLMPVRFVPLTRKDRTKD